MIYLYILFTYTKKGRRNRTISSTVTNNKTKYINLLNTYEANMMINYKPISICGHILSFKYFLKCSQKFKSLFLLCILNAKFSLF